MSGPAHWRATREIRPRGPARQGSESDPASRYNRSLNLRRWNAGETDVRQSLPRRHSLGRFQMRMEKRASGRRTVFTPAPAYPAIEGDVRPARHSTANPRARSLRSIDLHAVRAGDENEFTTPSKAMASWQAVSAAGSGLVVKASTRFAGSVGIAFPDVLVAILSWMATEFLMGCATYAEAMYPGMTSLDEVDDRAVSRAESDNFRKPSGLTPRSLAPRSLTPRVRQSLVLVARAEESADGSILGPTQPRPADIGYAGNDAVARPRAAPAAGAGWRKATVTFAIACVSGLRHRRGRQQSIMELRNLDDRCLRDIGISRCDIEYLANSRDPRE